MNAKPAVLFLSRWFPYPPHNGSRIRVYNLLKALSQSYPVDLLTFAEEELREEDVESMRAICRQVKIVPYRAFHPQGLRARMGFFLPRPRFLVDTYRPEITRLMHAMMQQQRYRLVLASEVDMLPYLEHVQGIPRLLEELEVGTVYEAWQKESRPLPRLRRWLTWCKLRLYLRRTLPRLQGCTAVSEAECQRIRHAVPNCPTLALIPNGVDSEHYAGAYGAPQPGSLIYNGALTYNANFDAMRYFLQEIFPLVREKQPQAHLHITGKTDGVPVEQLPLDGVTLTGYLDDIRPVVARSWLTVVPLRVGGGTRLKILESLALGTPVVSTSKGAEGLHLQHGEHILIADTPQAFARSVIDLLENPELRARLGRNGQEYVRQQYDWQSIGERLNTYLQNILEAY